MPDSMIRQLHNPFFLIGCGRSGTTMLASLLSNHPDLAVYPTEANDLWHPAAYPWHSKKVQAPPIWQDPYMFTTASLRARTDWDNQYLQAAFGAYQFLARGDCFINKNVMITFMVDRIRQLFPGARFIHLYRDGRAVALSYVRKERQKIHRHIEFYTTQDLDLADDELIPVFAEHWTQHIREIEKQKAAGTLVQGDSLLELSYESLCAKPQETMTIVAHFLGVDPSPFISQNYSWISTANHKFREQLDDSQISVISHIMSLELRLKGYEDMAED